MPNSLLLFGAAAAAVTWVYWRSHRKRPSFPTIARSKLVFLGSGDSSGTPVLFCLLGLIPGRPAHGCHVCNAARLDELSKHKRRNPCLLLQNPDRTFNALIDCGKTFRDAAARFFPEHGVNGVSAVLLTHEHADATFGLDELRTVQRINSTSPPVPKSAEEFAKQNLTLVEQAIGRVVATDKPDLSQREFELAKVQPHPLGALYQGVMIYVMERTRNAVAKQFPYLFSKGVGNVPRFVSQLEFETFDFVNHFVLANFFRPGEGLEVEAVRLVHGAGYDCAGFLFGKRQRVAYLSDVSWVPEETKQRLEDHPVEVLVLDALRPYSHDKHERPQVHFDLEDALQFVKALKVKPTLTLLTGLGHEFDYYEVTAKLDLLDPKVFGKVQLAYDGLQLDLDL
ncbi:hypothetical protein BASA81_011002 [Batrachochytrium salamandrivorans]|nr:hypothetical protein BASA81_011002 [Batrachochytrium salamandrivorans]